MKVCHLSVLGMIACFTISAATHTQAPAAPTKPNNSITSMVGMKAEMGSLVSVNQPGKSIILNSFKQQDTIFYTDSTLFRTADRKNSLSNLSVGTKVIVIYNVKNGQKVAIKIGEKLSKNANLGSTNKK